MRRAQARRQCACPPGAWRHVHADWLAEKAATGGDCVASRASLAACSVWPETTGPAWRSSSRGSAVDHALRALSTQLLDDPAAPRASSHPAGEPTAALPTGDVGSPRSADPVLTGKRPAGNSVDRAGRESSVAIATNETLSGWTRTFTDPRLCAAIMDRLAFGGNIIETGATLLPASPTVAQRGAG